MSKTRIFALIVIGLLLTAVLTNPSKAQMEDAVSTKAKTILQNQLNYKHADAIQLGMTLFGDRMIRELIQSHVTIRNYYVFSTVNIHWQGEETPIGGGAFRAVWLSPEIDSKVDEIITFLKDI